MKLKIINGEFSVCKVKSYEKVDLSAEFCFIGKTDEELSLVCLTENVPDNTINRDGGWRAFRIEGVLDFSLIGILAKISAVLAENEIGIFAVKCLQTADTKLNKNQYPFGKRADIFIFAPKTRFYYKHSPKNKALNC